MTLSKITHGQWKGYSGKKVKVSSSGLVTIEITHTPGCELINPPTQTMVREVDLVPSSCVGEE